MEQSSDTGASGERRAPADEAAAVRGPWTPSLAWKILVAFAAAAVAVALSSGVDGDGAAPAVGLLLAWGAVILLCTGTALAVVVRWDLSLPWAVVGYAVGYHALVVLVKFVLAPFGVYEVNRVRALEGLLRIDQAAGVVAAAAGVFLLYLAVYAGIYRFFRRRVDDLPTRGGLRRGTVRPRTVALVVVAGALVLAAATGGAALIVALILAGAGVEYLEFVFTSGTSVLVALALGCATWLAVRAFGTVTERARVVGDATVLVSFFWVGLAFLALYHALWVLYMLILITLWPLRAVVPK